MNEKSFFENLQTVGVKKLLEYVDSDFATALPKLIGWARKLDRDNQITDSLDVIESVLTDKDNNWYQLVTSAYDNIDKEVLKTLLENFIGNTLIIWNQRKTKAMEKYQCNIPWTLLIDPTSACNLKCTGCWAADYGNKMNMSYETLDDIIMQAKKLGIYMFLFSGGEPLVRKDDILKLCEKHNDCVFAIYTNGTLVDEKFADEMLRVKNILLTISIDGFEEANDFRRGNGTFHKIMNAMKILREKKLPFFASTTYTSKNIDVISSEAYFDFLIDQGVLLVWLFTYMPVGQNASTELLVSAEQRKYMHDQVREYRETKPIFTIDFWNDGEYVDGCMAAGKNYLHINANGDIEPCAFIHYSDTNIYDNTLIEALQSPLFKEYGRNQPFNDNALRPCPLLDNPDRLVSIIENTDAVSTDLAAPEDVHHLTGKTVDVAKKWEPVSNAMWKEKLAHKESKNTVLAK
jgi:MoaA/NifB/PqqE/SkfB family radical SAM enzyme